MYIKRLFYCFFLFAFIIQAQEPVSIHLSEKNGAPDKEFYDAMEDTKGFIWLCADKGLFRYDGKDFKKYTHAKQRGLSFFNVKEDALGRIWVNNISGQIFYVEADKLHLFADLSDYLKGELANYVIKKEYLWVFCLHKIYKVHLKTKQVTKLYATVKNILAPYKFKNEVYFTSQDSISKVLEKKSIAHLFPTNLPYVNANGKTIPKGRGTMFKIGNDLFFRQTRLDVQTFFKINIETKKIRKLTGFEAVAKERVYYEFENDNEIWLATASGVWVYAFINDSYKLKKRFLKDKHITKILKDKDDNYWLTTLNSGIYIIPNVYIETNAISETDKNISSLEKINDNTFAFGISNGNIGIYNTVTQHVKIVKLPTKDRVSSLKYLPKTNTIVISKDRNAYTLNCKSFAIERIIDNTLGNIKSFSLLDDNTLLLTDNHSVRVFENSNFKNKQRFISGEQRAYASLYDNTQKTVYIAYVNNFVVYDSLWKSKTISYKTKPIYGKSLTKTANGITWVATFKDGVYGIKNNEVIHYFTTANGLTSNNIQKIKADNNSLWIASDNSIQVLNVLTNNFKTLTKGDGIISYDISGIEILKDKILFSSNEGLFFVDKYKSFKKTIPDVYFNSLQINEKDTIISSNYRLKYDQNAIKISFNVNGFLFNQKGYYRYRLKGFNNDWLTTRSNTNWVKYSSLPAGNYTFQVQPVLENATVVTKIKELRFAIEKPFWKTWWFIVGILLLIIGIIVALFRNKIKKEAIENAKQLKELSFEKELVTLKLENLRSQMNPHFIFNALNSIQEYIVLNQKKLASDYLGKFADLIRTYLNHSTKGAITLKEEMDCLEMYLELEKLRFEDKLQYTITTTGNLSPDAISIPTMLIQPYVENALKHGLLHRKTDRDLQINFFINQGNNTVRCIILDNGVGREKAKKFKARSHKHHKSFATKATEDRLALLNYGKEKQVGVTITDLFNKEIATGTQVDISIPFKIN